MGEAYGFFDKNIDNRDNLYYELIIDINIEKIL